MRKDLWKREGFQIVSMFAIPLPILFYLKKKKVKIVLKLEKSDNRISNLKK